MEWMLLYFFFLRTLRILTLSVSLNIQMWADYKLGTVSVKRISAWATMFTEKSTEKLLTATTRVVVASSLIESGSGQDEAGLHQKDEEKD